jgi:hypothetical protein
MKSIPVLFYSSDLEYMQNMHGEHMQSGAHSLDQAMVQYID